MSADPKLDAIWKAIKAIQRRLTFAVGVPPAVHAPNHSSGSTDPIDILDLSGYPNTSPADAFLREDGTWAVPAGAGNVAGPGTSTDNGIPRFDGTTGDTLADTSGPTLEDDGRIANVTDPSSAQDAATKAYVDSVGGGGTDDYTAEHRPGKYFISLVDVGDYSTGCRFIANGAHDVTGAEFYVTGLIVGKNVKVTLWSDAGSSLATVTVNAVVSGSNVATFGSPYTMTAGTAYRLSMHVTDGSYYSYVVGLPAQVGTRKVMYTDTARYASGDAAPTTGSLVTQYPINPTFA